MVEVIPILNTRAAAVLRRMYESGHRCKCSSGSFVVQGGGSAAAFGAQSSHLVTAKVMLFKSVGLMESSDMSRTTTFLSSPYQVPLRICKSSHPFALQYLADQKASNDPISEVSNLLPARPGRLGARNYNCFPADANP